VIHEVNEAGKDPAAIPSHVRTEIQKFSGYTWKTILQWCRRAEEFSAQFCKLKLGKWGIRPFGSCKPQYKRSSQSLGARIRKPMANYQAAVIQQLKQWFERERNHGHEVSTALIKDFYIKFLERESALCKGQLAVIHQQVQQLKDTAVVSCSASADELQLLETEEQQLVLHQASALKQRQGQLVQTRQQLDSRIRMMRESGLQKVDKYFHSVLAKVGAHRRKPQRKCRLTPRQEYLRIALTWQSYDRAQFAAARGTDEELLAQVRDPAQWRQNLKQTVWAFWDHAPVWLKVKGDSKVLFSEAEQTNASTRRRLSKKSKDAALEFYAALVSDDPAEGVAEAQQKLAALAREAQSQAEEQQTQNPVQTRGVNAAGGDKFRVTAIFSSPWRSGLIQMQSPRARLRSAVKRMRRSRPSLQS